MKKPFILALDDDPSVIRAIERDLKSKFGAHYRVLASESPKKALDLCRQITARGDRIALFVVDQRMPQMSGTEFLREAIQIAPGARRVLLTAYADSNAAIEAINTLKLNHYLTKPWEPPEEKLFPILKDLLEDWNASNPATFEGTYIIGSRWSPDTHRLKDFLAKSQAPYRWAEPDQISDPRIRAALDHAQTEVEAAVDAVAVVFPDGSVLQKPTLDQVAEKLGLTTLPQRDFYDVIVVGAGPAGLACALYCSTEGLKTILVEREAAGGQAGLSSRIENYLGFPSGLSGADLARRGVAQVRRFGTELLAPADAVGLRVDGEYRVVKLSNGHELVGHSVVIAAGVQWRQLNIPGIEGLTGAGVYYGAATTEAPACKDEDVYVSEAPIPPARPRFTSLRSRVLSPSWCARMRCRAPCRSTLMNGSRRPKTSPSSRIVKSLKCMAKAAWIPLPFTTATQTSPNSARLVRCLSSLARSRIPNGWMV